MNADCSGVCSRRRGAITRRTALKSAAGALAAATIAVPPRRALAFDAFADLGAFGASSVTGPWPNINKSKLIQGLLERVTDPCKVDQGRRSLCGPAAIFHELARLQPARYVAIARSLYETGKFSDGTATIKPSKDLLNSQVPTGISTADWLLLASLRDSENFLFDVEHNDSWEEGLTGLTTPSDMVDWTEEILRFRNAESDLTPLAGEQDALREADKVTQAGGVAFLLIHTAMLPHGDDPWVSYPEHWVAYKPGQLSIKDAGFWGDDRLRFSVYTWGQCGKIVDIDEEPFEDFMFGVVTGQN
jgi:hypothetical protein